MYRLWDMQKQYAQIFMPPSPSKKEGHIALYMSVGMSVSRSNLVQLITQERFAPGVSNVVGR